MDKYLSEIVNWEVELDVHPEIGLQQTLNDQIKKRTKNFQNLLRKITEPGLIIVRDPDTPTLTPEITEKYVLNHLKNEGKQVSSILCLIVCVLINGW